MKKKSGAFRFKQFECEHYKSSMRIGVDAVLLGAWATAAGKRIMDVGTGCGVIAMMMAQRSPTALIYAIDIDTQSINEAAGNFQRSKWRDRLVAKCEDFSTMRPDSLYDVIVSNPPYFKSGIQECVTSRMTARHEGSLSPMSLLEHGRGMLAANGRIAMVVPFIRMEEIVAEAQDRNWFVARKLNVRGNPEAHFKRSLIEFTTDSTVIPIISELTLEESPGIPTPEHWSLCKDFYPHF